jgi:hypothetical protein
MTNEIRKSLKMLLHGAGQGAAAEGPETASWRWPSLGNAARAGILRQLERSGGAHLVFIRYSPLHDPGDEWVYNRADIDHSPVVWARELDRASNAGLMRYFDRREVWPVEPDSPQPGLTRYDKAPVRPMPFVPPGAPGIDALRSVDQVRRNVLERAGGDTSRSCDVWNFYFTQATGVAGPDVANGCYPGSDRAREIPFEQWFEWLLRQR